LSRSYSSGSLPNPDHDQEYDDEFDEFGIRGRHHRSESSSSSLPNFKQSKLKIRLSTNLASLPPTVWQKRASGAGSGGRTSAASSVGSGFSLDVSIPEHEFEHEHEHADGYGQGEGRMGLTAARMPRSMLPPPSLSRGGRMYASGDDVVNTPSTASTLSIPFPITPQDDHASDSVGGGAAVGKKMDKDKSLPPLPPSLKRSPTTYSNLRARKTSTGSGSGTATPPPLQYSTPVAGGVSKASSPGTMMTPKPLRLALAQSNLTLKPGDRPAVPVPSPISPPSLSSSYGVHMSGKRSPLPSPLLLSPRSRPNSALSSPVTPSSPTSLSASASASAIPTAGGVQQLKPKPRTGTGMVYRNSASRMRMPSSVVRATMTPVAGGVAGARPIAL